jgi:hypothetical protein
MPRHFGQTGNRLVALVDPHYVVGLDRYMNRASAL